MFKWLKKSTAEDIRVKCGIRIYMMNATDHVRRATRSHPPRPGAGQRAGGYPTPMTRNMKIGKERERLTSIRVIHYGERKQTRTNVASAYLRS
jgi:hypothetical protein